MSGSRPRNLPTLAELVGEEKALSLSQSIQTENGFNEAMRRPWTEKLKGDGNQTKKLQEAYHQYLSDLQATMIAVKDGPNRNDAIAKEEKSLKQVHAIALDWLWKKNSERTEKQIKSHSRFHTVLALYEWLGSQLRNSNIRRNTIETEKRAHINEAAVAMGRVNPRKSFAELHSQFAPPNPNSRSTSVGSSPSESSNSRPSSSPKK